MISVEQRLTWLAGLGAYIKWDALTKERVQASILDVAEKERAGAIVTSLIQNGFWLPADGFRDTGEFTCQIPALSRPTLKELQEQFPWANIKSIERDVSPVEATTLRLGTVLGIDEAGPISGAEYERRISSLTGLYGYQQLARLVKHQDDHPTFKALLGQIYIDGLGLIVVGAGGGRSFPYLDTDGERWSLSLSRLGYGFDRRGRLALSSK